MRLIGSGPEGIDPGNGLEHPARGPVGGRKGGSFLEKDPRRDGTAEARARGDCPLGATKVVDY